jgi:hypothetical protein
LKPEGIKKIRGSRNVFLRPLTGFTRLDYQRYSESRERLKATDMVKVVQGYQQNQKINWKEWKDNAFSKKHSITI